jgi:hypothetical protein
LPSDGENLKSIAACVILLAALLIIGCGGGGGGGGDTSATGVTGVTSSTTGINTGVFGTVRDSAGSPISNSTVTFYNSGGGIVGTGVTNSNGQFAAELPTTATRFTVSSDGSSAAGNVFGQFTYNGEDYLANDTGCLAHAPAFSSGQAVPLASDIVFTLRWMGPPPPPNGCLGP